MAEDELERRDIEALLAARRELGPEYDDVLVTAFAERVEREIGRRADAALDVRSSRSRSVERSTEGGRVRQFVLGIISLGVGVPVTIVPMVATDNGLPAVLVAWLGIVGVNAAHAASVNGPRRAGER